MPTKPDYIALMNKLRKENNWQSKPNGTTKFQIGGQRDGLRLTGMNNGNGFGICVASGGDKGKWFNQTRYETRADLYERVARIVADAAEEAGAKV
jgi:hypothetical protein